MNVLLAPFISRAVREFYRNWQAGKIPGMPPGGGKPHFSMHPDDIALAEVKIGESTVYGMPISSSPTAPRIDWRGA